MKNPHGGPKPSLWTVPERLFGAQVSARIRCGKELRKKHNENKLFSIKSMRGFERLTGNVDQVCFWGITTPVTQERMRVNIREYDLGPVGTLQFGHFEKARPVDFHDFSPS
ncbi:MAG TPA: hypothetical protein VGH07_03620, partial [Chthoniobacterales bacterium]